MMECETAQPAFPWTTPTETGDYLPTMTAIPSADEAAHNAYLKLLRQYFVRGVRTNESVSIKGTPVLFAPGLRDKSEMEFAPAFPLLNVQLARRKERYVAFLRLLKKSIAGLNDLLFLQSKEGGADALKRRFEFAGDMIAFDRVAQVARNGTSSELPEARLQRLELCLLMLEEARTFLKESGCVIFTTPALAKEYALEELLNE